MVVGMQEVRAMESQSREAVSAALARRRVQLPKKGRGRPPAEVKRGDPRSFRPEPDVEAYLVETKAAGIGFADLMNNVLRFARDVTTEMGDDWWELERRAKVEGVTDGTLAGRLLKAALGSTGTHRPKK